MKDARKIFYLLILFLILGAGPGIAQDEPQKYASSEITVTASGEQYQAIIDQLRTNGKTDCQGAISSVATGSISDSARTNTVYGQAQACYGSTSESAVANVLLAKCDQYDGIGNIVVGRKNGASGTAHNQLYYIQLDDNSFLGAPSSYGTDYPGWYQCDQAVAAHQAYVAARGDQEAEARVVAAQTAAAACPYSNPEDLQAGISSGDTTCQEAYGQYVVDYDPPSIASMEQFVEVCQLNCPQETETLETTPETIAQEGSGECTYPDLLGFSPSDTARCADLAKRRQDGDISSTCPQSFFDAIDRKLAQCQSTPGEEPTAARSVASEREVNPCDKYYKEEVLAALDAKLKSASTAAITGYSSSGAESDFAIYSGTTFYENCQGHADVHWDKMFKDKDNGAALEAHWNKSWYKQFDKYKARIIEAGEKCNEAYEAAKTAGDDVTRATESYIAALRELIFNTSDDEATMGLLKIATQHFKTIRHCSALVYLTTKTDYENSEVGSKETKKSHDSSITCTRAGAETQDYAGCVNLINAYDVAYVAEQALQIEEQVEFQLFSNDLQTTLQNADSDDVTAALEAQRDSIEKQKDIAIRRAAEQAAKAITIEGFVGGIPTLTNIVDSCKEVEKTDKFYNFAGLSGFKEIMRSLTGAELTVENSAIKADYSRSNLSADEQALVTSAMTDLSNSLSDSCAKVALNRGVELVKNSAAIDQGHAAAVQATLQGAAQGGIAAILADQVKQIEKMIANVDELDPEEYGTLSLQDAIFSKCQVDPSDPVCSTLGSGRTSQGFAGQNISFSTSRNQIVANSDDSIDATTNSDTDDGTTGSGIDEPGNIITPRAGDGSFSKVSAATVKEGGAGGSSAGGGGGSVGSVSAPGSGAGSSSSGGLNSAYSGNSSAARKYSYSGSGKGSLSYRGGSGSSTSKSSSSSENPFSKLFNKDKGTSSDVTNFRELASEGKIGSKDGKDLFKMITSRYETVNKSKRLLEYEKNE